MASQREKLLESAQRFILKGQIDKAIKDYQQVVALDPKDTRHRQRLAELLVRTGRSEEAVTEYEAIGKFYADNGYYLKAIAVYKQIQKLTPDNIQVTITLGTLNGKQGLTGNALDEYRTAVNFFEKNSQLAEAVKVVEKMLELDAENPATCQKHAELLFARKEFDSAFDAYTRLLGLLQVRGDAAAYEKIETRLSNLFPDRAKLSLEALAAMVDTDVDSAIGKLSGLIKQDSTNLPAWQLLVRAYQVKDDQEKLRLTYDLIIRLFPGELFAREGIIDSAIAEDRFTDAVDLLGVHAASFLEQDYFDTLERLYLAVQDHTDDERVTAGLRALYLKSGEAEKLALLDKAEEPPEPEFEDLAPLEEAEIPLPEMEPFEPEYAESPEPALPESPFGGAAEVFSPVAESWEEDIYLSIDDDEALDAELEAFEEDEASEAMPADDGAPWPDAATETQDLSADESPELQELDLDQYQDLPAMVEDLSEEGDDLAALDLNVELPADALSPEVGFDEGEDGEELLVADVADDEPADIVLADELDVELDELAMDEFVEEPLSEEDCLLSGDAAPAIELTSIGTEHGEPHKELHLEEADQSVEGEDVLLITDEPAGLQLDVSDLVEHDQLVLVTAEGEGVSELSLIDVEEPDLEELSDDISKGIDQLFDDFETLTLEEEPAAGVKTKYSWDGMLSEADEQASLGDAETHFDLGIAYKEMGLYDDAIAEFKRAAISPNRKLDCIILQAGCYREKNEFQGAEDLLFDAMTLKEATTEDLLGLKYELALVYEMCGRLDEALVIYNQVRKEDPEFHGVSAKIASLEGGEDSLDLTDVEYEELEELVEMPDSGSK